MVHVAVRTYVKKVHEVQSLGGVIAYTCIIHDNCLYGPLNESRWSCTCTGMSCWTELCVFNHAVYMHEFIHVHVHIAGCGVGFLQCWSLLWCLRWAISPTSLLICLPSLGLSGDHPPFLHTLSPEHVHTFSVQCTLFINYHFFYMCVYIYYTGMYTCTYTVHIRTCTYFVCSCTMY